MPEDATPARGFVAGQHTVVERGVDGGPSCDCLEYFAGEAAGEGDRKQQPAHAGDQCWPAGQ